MIIESTDGSYYQNPCFLRETWQAWWRDDAWVFFAANQNRLEKPTKHGFKGETRSWLWEEQVFKDGTMKHCLPSTILLSKPIPPPDAFDCKYDQYLPRSEELLCWSYPFSSQAVLDFMQGANVPDIAEFLGKNARRKIVLQTGYAASRWKNFTPLCFGSTFMLRRRDPFYYAPGLPT